MKKLFAILVVLVVFVGLTGCTNSAKGPKVGIIQLAEHVALDSASEGFIAALEDGGYVDGENITIDLQNAQGEQTNLSTIGDRFVSEKVDLILAVATPAAQSIAGKTSTIPILGTAITDYVDARLALSNEEPGLNVSGTTDMNPIKEQIELLIKLAPETKTVGVIYNSSEDNSILQAKIAKENIEGMGLNYEEVTVTSSNDVQQATQSLVEKCDAIYIPTDNTLATAMPVVHGVVVKSKTPMVCGEESMVREGGLATIGINYYDLGYQTGLMAMEILKDKADISKMPIKSATKFDFAINGNVAEEIGIAIPDDLTEHIIDE